MASDSSLEMTDCVVHYIDTSYTPKGKMVNVFIRQASIFQQKQHYLSLIILPWVSADFERFEDILASNYATDNSVY